MKNQAMRDDTAKQIKNVRRLLKVENKELLDKPSRGIIIDGLWKIIVLVCVALIVVWFMYGHAQASEEIPDDKAILAIIGEAEDQGYNGMLAVACALRNRGTLHGVYGLNAPRVKKSLYTKRIYLQAREAWETSKKLISWGDNYDASGGANSWENINSFGKPYWVDSCKKTLILKDHVFYNCPKGV